MGISPLTDFMEGIIDYFGSYESRRKLDTRLIFGMYPEIITSEGDEVELLRQLTGSYLYRVLIQYIFRHGDGLNIHNRIYREVIAIE